MAAREDALSLADALNVLVARGFAEAGAPYDDGTDDDPPGAITAVDVVRPGPPRRRRASCGTTSPA